MKPIASLHLTLIFLTALAAILVYNRITDENVNLIVALPMAGLCINLLAALITNPKIRTQGGLLVFHLGLAAVLLLIAGGRLVTLKGLVEVLEGEPMNPASVEGEPAPFYPGTIDEVMFTQGEFRIDYEEDLGIGKIYSDMLLPDGQGGRRTAVAVGDQPLLIKGHRFYPTSNKGFAPIVSYVDDRGAAQIIALHMPSYPLKAEDQSTLWTMPGADKETLFELIFSKPILDMNGPWSFHKPENPTLRVTIEDVVVDLKLGEGMLTPGGQLFFEEVRTWMGYTILYDPTIPWVLAASLIAVLGLAWHIIGKFRATSWDQE